jgi:hypothetical protein
MAYRSEIETALDEMIADEGGMKFQSVAVVLAKQKWPQLVACERKWDGGLDAYANGELEPEGKGIGLACSLTATLGKVEEDAAKAKRNYPDVRVLIFATPAKVTSHTGRQWAADIEKDFGFELVIVSREDLVTSLLDPRNADICKAQLGITVPVPAALEPSFESSLAAAAEVADDWERRSRSTDRPLIDLEAEKPETGEERGRILTLETLRSELARGGRIILEAPAGRGKTTTLVQLAKRMAAEGSLALLVDLPVWAKSGKDILAFVAEKRQFLSRAVDAATLAKLRGSKPMVFLLNGWNEVSASTVEAAMLQLSDLERNFPSAGIVVATRTHHLTPPLPGAFRATLRPLSREQRNQYLQLALGASAHGLRVKLDNNRMLDQITRTPLILAEVSDLFRSGKEIPSTKMGVLNAVMQVMEQSGEHRVHLQQAPLGGYPGEYLRALSMEMTERNEVEMSEADARAIVHSVSTMLRAANQIANVPEPLDVLNELSKHHILERIEHPDAFFRFQHQQFQEYFAANGLKTRLGDVVRGKSQEEEENFLKHFVNEPKWGESLRMMAEEIGTASASKEMVDGGAKLVCMALKVDPIFAGELGRWCGPTVWEEVGNEVGERLRAYYAQPDRHEKECALAAMLSTGRHDFADVLIPLLSTSDRQIRLALYYGGVEFLPSCIGRTGWRWSGVGRRRLASTWSSNWRTIRGLRRRCSSSLFPTQARK